MENDDDDHFFLDLEHKQLHAVSIEPAPLSFRVNGAGYDSQPSRSKSPRARISGVHHSICNGEGRPEVQIAFHFHVWDCQVTQVACPFPSYVLLYRPYRVTVLLRLISIMAKLDSYMRSDEMACL